MGYDLSGILGAVQLLLNDSIQKAGYDKTVIGTIVECIDPETHSYKVEYQNSTFTAVAYNTNSFYNAGEVVYVILPSNDINYIRIIIGKVSQKVLDIIDVSQKELDRYSSLGTISFSDIYTVNQDEKIKNIDLSTEEIDNEVLKSGFMASPYFILKTKISTDIKEKNPKGNYGIKITFTFKSIEGEYDKTYIFDINKMFGQPYDYNGSEQHIIFQINNASQFKNIKSFEIFSEDFKEKYSIKFQNIEFYVASKTGEKVNKYSVEITPRDISVLKDTFDTVVLKANVKISNEQFETNNIEYYWFIEDLRIKEGVDGFSSYGGQGWRCLNDTRKTEDADGAIIVVDYKNNISTLTISHRLNTPINTYSHNNIYKCVIKYRENKIISNEFEVIDYQYPDYNINLSSSVMEMFKKEGEYVTNAVYDYTANGVDSTSLRLSDKAKVQVNFDKSEGHSYTYLWQKVYSNEDNELLDNEANNGYQYIFGDSIDKYVVFKCGIKDGDNYLGSSRIKLTNIEQNLTAYLVSKENTFNSLTGDGKYDGIYFVKEIKDEEGNIISTKKIENVTDFSNNSEDVKLFINATYIRAGHLEVGGKDANGTKRTVFYADIDDYTKTQIGGFIVTPYSLFNNGTDIIINEDTTDIPREDINTISQGVYLGIDGLFVGDSNNFAKISHKIDEEGNKTEEWELNLTGNINATSGSFTGTIVAQNGKIGGFDISETDLRYTNNNDIDVYLSGNPQDEYFIWASNNQEDNFWVKKDGSLYANNVNITGEIHATAGSFDGTIIAQNGNIGGFTITEASLTSGSGSNIITISGSSNEYFIRAGGATLATAKFNISKAGILSAQDADIKGVITATSGKIGNWSIDSNGNLYSGNNTTYINLNSQNGISEAFWCGNNDRTKAPFRILKNGDFYSKYCTIANFNFSNEYFFLDENKTVIDYNFYYTTTSTYNVYFYSRMDIVYKSYYRGSPKTIYIMCYLKDSSGGTRSEPKKTYFQIRYDTSEIEHHITSRLLNFFGEASNIIFGSATPSDSYIQSYLKLYSTDSMDFETFSNLNYNTIISSWESFSIKKGSPNIKSVPLKGCAAYVNTNLKTFFAIMFPENFLFLPQSDFNMGTNAATAGYFALNKTSKDDNLNSPGFFLNEEGLYLNKSCVLRIGSTTLTEADIQKLHNL